MPDAPKLYTYHPAKCLKCGDVTNVMRHRIFGGTEAGRCRLKVGSGICRGRVGFLVNDPRPKLKKAQAIEMINDYDTQRELDKLAAGIGQPDRWGQE